MKKLMLIAVTGLILVAIAAPALALGPLDADAGLALNGKNVWRGLVRTPDPVLQPEVGLGVLGFTAGFWGNIDTNDVNGSEWEFNQINWTLGYELGLAILKLDAGFIYYDYSNGSDVDTSEFYLGAAVNVLLSPSLKVYQDLDAHKGAYWEAQISHGVTMGSNELELSGGVGFGSKGYIEGYFGPASELPTVPEVPGDASLTDYHIKAALPFHPLPMFTVTPSVMWSSLSGDVKTIVDSSEGVAYHGESDAFVWGLNASFSF
ncbi:MAG: hypothetical protein ACI9UQ_001590 [Candidatus Krumholzibacteriia bacterium]|jgi:hypothetical protein